MKEYKWDKAKAFYMVNGNQRKTAEKFKIPYPHLRKRAVLEGWSTDRGVVKERIRNNATKIVQKTTEKEIEKLTKEKYEIIKEVSFATINLAKKTALNELEPNMYSLKLLADITEKFQKIINKELGISDTIDITSNNEKLENNIMIYLPNNDRD